MRATRVQPQQASSSRSRPPGSRRQPMMAASQLSGTSMAALERKLEQLPLLPAVVSGVLSLNPEADDYFDRLLRLAERDPPFAIRVLRCANSAFYAPESPIVSLQQAIMRIGTQECARLVLALAVVKVFIPHTEAQRSLWIHSLQTALFARMFSQRLAALRRDADHAYLCGLLHDIGRFVQFEGAPADLARIDDTHWASPQELVDRERSVLGYDHALLGWHACQKWSLPATVGAVVHHHHDPMPMDMSASPDLVRVVQWADMLSVALITNPELATAPPDELAHRLQAEYPRIAPGLTSDKETSWHRCVSGVHAESMQLVRQLGLR